MKLTVTADAERVAGLVIERGTDDLSSAVYEWVAAVPIDGEFLTLAIAALERQSEAVNEAAVAAEQQGGLAASTEQRYQLKRLKAAIDALVELRDDPGVAVKLTCASVREAVANYANEAR